MFKSDCYRESDGVCEMFDSVYRGTDGHCEGYIYMEISPPMLVCHLMLNI